MIRLWLTRCWLNRHPWLRRRLIKPTGARMTRTELMLGVLFVGLMAAVLIVGA